MRLLILPRYTAKGPSSRVRIYQYLPYLKEAGFEYEVQPFFKDDYITRLFDGKPKDILSIIKGYFKRITIMIRAHKYDVVWLQYELLPWVPFWLERLYLFRKKRIIIDYDDAVFHRYDQHSNFIVRHLLGKKIDRLMSTAQIVIVGNEYLADKAREAGARQVEIIPSVVDLSRYSVKRYQKEPFKNIHIGWLGSPKTIMFIREIEDVIREITDLGIEFVIIGAKKPSGLASLPITELAWSLETEAESIQYLDIGIMPLPDTPFERGKCGYKLIQYMACGLPVVASPVGINQKIIKHGENGFLASNEEEWIDAITKLQINPILRKEMGLKGRKIVDEEYALQVTAPKIIKIMKEI